MRIRHREKREIISVPQKFLHCHEMKLANIWSHISSHSVISNIKFYFLLFSVFRITVLMHCMVNKNEHILSCFGPHIVVQSLPLLLCSTPWEPESRHIRRKSLVIIQSYYGLQFTKSKYPYLFFKLSCTQE